MVSPEEGGYVVPPPTGTTGHWSGSGTEETSE
jgi:hypothetical protein